MKSMKAMKAMKVKVMKQPKKKHHFIKSKAPAAAGERRDEITALLKKLHNKTNPKRRVKPLPAADRVQAERKIKELVKERDELTAAQAAAPAAPVAPAVAAPAAEAAAPRFQPID